MSLTPLPPTDTRTMFRPLCRELAELLARLPAGHWTRPAVRAWQVRDVAAHLIDITLRRLSFHRDGHTPPPPPFPIAGEQDFIRFINQINADWVTAFRRLSPRQLAALYAEATREFADFIEAVPADAPGLFGVSWAGETESAGWFDIGREFTEQWHHQAQIREAVGAPPPSDPAWLHATLLIALRGLPHAYRAHDAPDGRALAIEVTGDAGGVWTLQRTGGAWRLYAGATEGAAAGVALSDDTARRLLFNGLPAPEAARTIRITGDTHLAAPFLRARSIVV